MDKEQVNKVVDALIKCTQAMEKAITILVGSLPNKDDFDIIRRGEEDAKQ